MQVTGIIQTKEQAVWNLLEQVCDPEVPVLSVVDLGIIRDIYVDDNLTEITITPTYSGCPAMDVIAMNIRLLLLEHGYKNLRIKTILSPAWTTDWMTDAGKRKLEEYGIAPPKGNSGSLPANGIKCPQCASFNTVVLSQFGSTACKALYQCLDCKEPFDYFKCH